VSQISRSLCLTLIVGVASQGGLRAQELVPGRVVGDLKFLNPSSDVLNWLSTNPAVTPSSNAVPPIYLRRLTTGTVEAQASYVATNTAAGSDYTLGTFDMNPSVLNSGSNFQISAESVRFTGLSSYPTYRFGSKFASGIGARVCSGVLPLTINPAGSRCDQSECAVRLNMTFRFVGSTSALDTSALAPPAICNASSAIAEANGFDDQASSAKLQFAVSDLITGTKTISLIVRGNQEARVGVFCTAPVASGQTGFVIIPGTNMTPLSSTRMLTPACPLSGTPTSAIPLTFDLQVVPTAGSIKGLFDLVGHTEDNPRVRIGDISSPFVTTPQIDPMNPSGPLKWQLDGVPSGSSPVTAWTLTDQKDSFVIFPARDGLNERVAIQAGSTADLGTTFVARPADLQGQVTLFDFGTAYLGSLVLTPFTSSESVFNRTSSHAEAQGNPSYPEAGGSSGIGGVSRGRLRGSYSASTRQAILNYDLFLPGIDKDANGSVENTSWDFNSLYLQMAPGPNTSENLSVVPGTLLRIDTGSPPSSTPVIAPPQSYCFGSALMIINVNPAVGSLFAPFAYFSSTTNYQADAALGTTPVASVTGWTRQNTTFAQRAPTVSLANSVVAGLGYRFSPAVRFAAVGATSDAQATTTSIPSINVPVSGIVGCADHVEVCISAGGATGPFPSLSVDILEATGTSGIPYCLASGPATFTIKVNSNSPTEVKYEMDPASSGCSASAQVLCGSGTCSANPQFTVSFPSLSVGAHLLRACASDAPGCAATRDLNFQVTSQNLGISCPSAIAVTLNVGETSLARSDARINPLLHATVTGTCGIPPAITDNAPDIFPVGTTTVLFTAPGLPSCSTPVTINLQTEAQLGVKAQRSGIATLEIYRTSNPFATLMQSVTVGKPFEYAFSPDGSRVAIATNDGTTGVVDLSSGAPFLALANTAATSIRPPLVVAWHRSGGAYAVLGRGMTSPRPTVKVFSAGSAGAPTEVQWTTLPVPAGLDRSLLQLTAMSYSSDQNRIVIAGSGPTTAVPPRYLTIAFSSSTDSGGRFTVGVQTAMTPPVREADRESVHEILANSSVIAIATTRRVYTLDSTGTTLTRRFAHTNMDAALASSGSKTALTELTATAIHALLIDPGGTSLAVSPDYNLGKTKGEIAITEDAKRIAVVAQPGIVVYDDAFTQVSMIPDPTVAFIRFRPR
jgi:hypothetical protein